MRLALLCHIFGLVPGEYRYGVSLRIIYDQIPMQRASALAIKVILYIVTYLIGIHQTYVSVIFAVHFTLPTNHCLTLVVWLKAAERKLREIEDSISSSKGC